MGQIVRELFTQLHVVGAQSGDRVSGRGLSVVLEHEELVGVLELEVAAGVVFVVGSGDCVLSDQIVLARYDLRLELFDFQVLGFNLGVEPFLRLLSLSLLAGFLLGLVGCLLVLELYLDRVDLLGRQLVGLVGRDLDAHRSVEGAVGEVVFVHFGD